MAGVDSRPDAPSLADHTQVLQQPGMLVLNTRVLIHSTSQVSTLYLGGVLVLDALGL